MHPMAIAPLQCEVCVAGTGMTGARAVGKWNTLR